MRRAHAGAFFREREWVVPKYIETQLEQLLTSRECAAFFKVTKRVLFTLDIPYIKIKQKRCYDPADIRAWITKHRVNVDRLRPLGPRPRWSIRRARLEERPRQQTREKPENPYARNYDDEWAVELYPNDPKKQELYKLRCIAARKGAETRVARNRERRLATREGSPR